MKVLFVPFNYQNPFQPLAALFFRDQAIALADAGIKVTVLSAVSVSLNYIIKKKGQGLGFRYWKDNGVEVYQFMFPAIPKAPRLTQWMRVFVQKYLYRKIVRHETPPNISHVQMFPGGDFANWLHEKYSIPYVVTEHLSGFAQGVYNKWQINNASRSYARARARIAVSEHLASTLTQITNSSFEVIPNCVNVSMFDSLEVNSKPIRKFINIGRLDPIKNQTTLIKAFVQADLPKECTLTIVGDGEEYRRLENQIERLNAKGRVTLYGAATKDEVVELLKKHDGFVLSSTYETFGVVLIEALAMGLPVLSTNCLGAEEIIIDAKLGCTCDPDENSLRVALEEFSQKSFDSNEIRRYAVANFSNETFVKRVTSIYQQVIA